MIRILNTTGADSNIEAKVEMMDIDNRMELKAIMDEEVDYQDEDVLVNKADKIIRYIANYIYTRKTRVTKETIASCLEDDKDVDIKNSPIPHMQAVLLDLEPYIVKYIIEVLDMYPSTAAFNNTQWEEEMADEEFVDIIPFVAIYVPIYNTDKNVIKNVVCINSF